MNLHKKYLYQITPYYPPHLGGMQNCVQEISHRLSAKGYNVTVLTSDIAYNGKLKSVHNKQITVKYLHSIEVAHTPISLSLINELIKIPDDSLLHIHVANAFFPEVTYAVSQIKKLPYVVHYHIDVDASGIFGNILPLYKKYILKNVLSNAKKIIALSDSQKKLLMDKYSLPEQLISVVPNGINEMFFLDKRVINQNAKKLLYVGRLSRQKNIGRLIKTMALLDPSFELHIVGEGDQRESITVLIKELHLSNVYLHGAQFGNELKKYYEMADMFVLPSNNEGMSLALLEAVAAGLPIVTTYLPQTKDFLEHGAVLVADPTPERFAEAITKLSADRQAKEEMSMHNLHMSNNYTWEKVVNEIENIYKSII